MQTEIRCGGVYARAWGDSHDAPVLLVHGVSGTSWDWIRSIMRLPAHSRYFVAVDLPGFGRSEWLGSEEYSPETLALALDRFSDEVFGHNGYAYVGHSYGGKMGILLAGQAGSRVERLTLLDNGTDLGPGSAAVRKRLREWPTEFPSLLAAMNCYRQLYGVESDDVALLRFNEYLTQAGDGSVALRRDPQFVESMVASNPDTESGTLREAWSRITQPVHIVRAERSKMLTEETVSSMLATNPHASASVARGSGHNLLSECPELVAERLASSLVIAME